VNDPALARLIGAWAGLPEAIRRAVLALVETAGMAERQPTE
jgi:hypothetical protein